MVENKTELMAARQGWERPELKRLAAGSAEQGPANVNEDGGPTLNPRS